MPIHCCAGSVLVLLLAGLFAAPVSAGGPDRAEIERGRAIAEARCGRCHAVGVDDDSPHRITPPFRELTDSFPVPMLAEAATTGVLSGHDEMPMFEFSAEDMAALLAYIDSLNPAASGYRRSVPASR